MKTSNKVSAIGLAVLFVFALAGLVMAASFVDLDTALSQHLLRQVLARSL
ncbi:hypothetical protein K8Q98_02235 [Candidatus Nomurabacteria bacterium]|nr:hypothetical protein [Candidatus Nomurabacteria bacterium]